MAKTATRIRDVSESFNGTAALYELSEPVSYDYDFEAEENTKTTSFVIVSATNVLFSGPETYIFPATSEGDIADWGELPGSFKGGLDHETALRGAGFEVA